MRSYKIKLFQRKSRAGWYGRYRQGGKYVIEKFGDTLAEAELKRSDTHLKINSNALPIKQESHTWDAMIEAFITHLKADKKRPKTVRDCKNTLAGFMRICGPLSSRQINRACIDRFKLNRQGVTVDTVNHDLRIIRAFFNWLYEMNMIPSQIPVKVLKKPDSEPFCLPDKDVKALLKAAEPCPKMKLFIQIALSTGLRRSDIQKIAESDIDRKNKTIVSTLRKTGVTVKIPVSEELIKAIDNYLFQYVPKDWELIFHPKRLPVEMDYPFADKEWNHIRIKAGLFKGELSKGKINKKLSRKKGTDSEWLTDFKALRSTAFTNMAEQGIPVEVVQKIAGHKSIQTTMKFYLHVRESRMKKLAKIPNSKKWFAIDNA